MHAQYMVHGLGINSAKKFGIFVFDGKMNSSACLMLGRGGWRKHGGIGCGAFKCSGELLIVLPFLVWFGFQALTSCPGSKQIQDTIPRLLWNDCQLLTHAWMYDL
jgi:hypothetical protein